MLLKYTGPKSVKAVQYNGKEFLFIPECEVDDMNTIKHLLHPDMKGLFERVVEPTPSKEKQETKEPAKKPQKGTKKK